MATFLSAEHFSLAKDALDADAGFQNAIANVDLSVQFDVSDGPEGCLLYTSDAADDRPRV